MIPHIVSHASSDDCFPRTNGLPGPREPGRLRYRPAVYCWRHRVGFETMHDAPCSARCAHVAIWRSRTARNAVVVADWSPPRSLILFRCAGTLEQEAGTAAVRRKDKCAPQVAGSGAPECASRGRARSARLSDVSVPDRERPKKNADSITAGKATKGAFSPFTALLWHELSADHLLGGSRHSAALRAR
jgi:hypothetical protein